MIRHLLVTSLESGRLALAATASLSVARELDPAQNESCKDRPRDRPKPHSNTRRVGANLMIALSETEDAKI